MRGCSLWMAGVAVAVAVVVAVEGHDTVRYGKVVRCITVVKMMSVVVVNSI